jgi:hypothetical protein
MRLPHRRHHCRNDRSKGDMRIAIQDVDADTNVREGIIDRWIIGQ